MAASSKPLRSKILVLKSFRILIFYEDFDEYVNAYKNFKAHEATKGVPLDRGSVSGKSYSEAPSTPSPDIAASGQSQRGLSEAGGAFTQDKERPTVVAMADEEEKA